MTTSLFSRLALLVVLVASIQSTAIASVQINLGGSPLTGSAATIVDDAISLLFEDVALNQVRLTISVKPPSTKVTQLLFNIDPLITGLSLSNVDLPNTNTPNTLSLSQNAKGMGGPLTGFDIELLFDQSGAQGALNPTSSPAIFLITKAAGTATLTANSFNVATSGGYYGAVHINLPTGSSSVNSGKYGSIDTPLDPNGEPDGAVPEPTSLVTFSVLGVAAALRFYRRK